MSYEKFTSAAIGSIFELFPDFGMIRFVKCSSTKCLVDVALKNDEPFIYTHFTNDMSIIQASVLFDKYSK